MKKARSRIIPNTITALLTSPELADLIDDFKRDRLPKCRAVVILSIDHDDNIDVRGAGSSETEYLGMVMTAEKFFNVGIEED